MASEPLVSCAPPAAPRALPWLGSTLPLLRDPVGYLGRCRSRVGDSFTVRFLGREVLFLFSAKGVRSLWAAPERELSKGLADFEMLRHKIPEELFAGRRTRPHDLFSRDDVAEYLRNLEEAVDLELAALGPRGEVELFALTRRLSHRVGLACWGGITGAALPHLDALIRSLDVLDTSDAFVRPLHTMAARISGKRAARRALAELERRYLEIVRCRSESPAGPPDLFDRICETWADVESPEREVGIARDCVLVHMGSMSNLFAANAWTVIHLLERPDLLEAVRAGDAKLLESCIHESIRLRQRSVVLRRALRETSLSDESSAYKLRPGAFAATMMPNTNLTELPGLDGFDPGRYVGPRFVRAGELAARELVSTFGHGAHACPALRFSIESIRVFVAKLLERFSLEPLFSGPRPLRTQIGGVARADRPCRVRYAAVEAR